MGTHSSCLSRTDGQQLVVTLLEVSEREEGVVAKHLSIGSLKTRSGLQPVPRCEPTGRKEMFYLTTHSTHFIYGYLRQTYGKGPFR